MQLREVGEKQNLTIEELGTQAAVPAITISAIEEGRVAPSQINGIKLAKGNGVRPDETEELVASYIISGEGKGESPGDPLHHYRSRQYCDLQHGLVSHLPGGFLTLPRAAQGGGPLSPPGRIT